MKFIEILLIILASNLLTIIIFSLLYLKFGVCKVIYHDILGWHQPKDENDTTFDGCNFHNICKYCGEEIIQDSQGNWFVV
jgi:hypothetical protein